MNEETKCSVVRDLLPGYIENLTGEKTCAFVSEHLAECAECRAAYRAMGEKLSGESVSTEALLKNMKRRRRLRLVRVACAMLLVLLLAAVCLLPLPRRIAERTYQAVEWRCGGEESVSRAVTVDGYYMDYLFLADKFTGSLVIEGYPLTTQSLTASRFENGFAMLSYFVREPAPDADDWEAGMLHHFGLLMMAPDGERFAVCVYEDNGWDGSDGLVISGPASTRKEAVGIARMLAQAYSPKGLGLNRWEGLQP